MRNPYLWSRLIAISLAAFISLIFIIDYRSSIILLILSPFAFTFFYNNKLLLYILVILPIFIEVSFQQIPFFALENTIVNFNGVINIWIIGTTIFYIATRRINIFKSYITKPFVLYLLVILVSLTVSTYPLITIKSFVRITTAYCVYLMITQFINKKEDIDKLFKVFLFILLIPVIIGMYQIVIENKFLLSRGLRIKGTFKNGQSYSQYLAFLLPFIFARLTSIREFLVKKIFILILFFLGLINLLFTGTRIGWGALILALIIYCILTKKIKYLTVVTVLLICLLIIFYPFFKQYFATLLTTPFSAYSSNYFPDQKEIVGAQNVSSMHIRVYIWKHMIQEVFKKNPLLGLGSGTWFGFFSEKISIPIASHNDYVQVFFGTGFIGLFFYLIFRFNQIGLLIKFSKLTDKYININTAIMPSLAVYISFIFVSITEVWQAYDGLYWTSWIILGISECYYKNYISERSRND